MSAPSCRKLSGCSWRVALAVGLAAAGCGEGGGGAPAAPAAPATPAPAPTPAPTPQPSITVSFAEAAVRVAEGQTAEVPVRWSGSVSSALRIGVAARNGSATGDDYELLTADFEIAASAAGGTAAVSLRALEDGLFAEGDETLSVQLSAPAGTSVQFGGELAVSIEDAGVSPCAGVRVSADPPLLRNFLEGRTTVQPSETATTVFKLVTGPGAEAVTLDWIGPYRDYDLGSWNPSNRPRTVNPTNLFDVVVANWSFEPEESAFRHEFEVEWLSELEIGLRFRSADGACTGEPVAACTGGGCELRP